MASERNSPELWNRVWNRKVSLQEDQFHLESEERSIRWQRIETRVKEQFGNLQGLRVVEIGVGRDSNAALFAKRGSTVTVLDYSDAALQRSAQFFNRFGLKVKTLYADALELPGHLLAKFDVAISFGLAEHFQGEERDRISQAHFDLVRPGGLVFIAVPNRNNPPYRILRYLAQKRGRPGEESPYSRSELDDICKRTGVSQYEYFSSSFAETLQFLNPFRKRRFGSLMKHGTTKNDSRTLFKWQPSSVLDTQVGNSLVLCGRKPCRRTNDKRRAPVEKLDAGKQASLASMH